MSVSEKSNIGNSYYTKLVLGPGAKKKTIVRKCIVPKYLLPIYLDPPSPPIVITMGKWVKNKIW